MGCTIKVICIQCGYNRPFRIGMRRRNIGPMSLEAPMHTMYTSLENPKIKENAFKLIAGGGVLNAANYRLYGCPRCKRLVNRRYSRIVIKEKIYEPTFKCSKCRRMLLYLHFDSYPNKTFLKWDCPSCSHNRLYIRLWTLWD